MVLQVQLTDPRTGAATRTQEFTSSPVRVGRNQLNDVPLDDPFVSEWHGIIRFGEGGVAYFDLGSTNGTSLDGRRLTKNEPTPIQGTARLGVGRLELIVSWRKGAATSEPPPPVGAAKTLAWGPRAGRASLDHGSGPVPEPRSNEISAPVALAGASSSASIPTPPAAGYGVGVATPPRETVLRLENCLRVIEAFSEAFVGLRKGVEQFGAGVGVRPVSGTTPLHPARSAKEVMDYLVGNENPTPGVRDLIAIFADLGIHHIALMEGITQGVRGMLAGVDPRAHGLEPASRLFGGKPKAEWRAWNDKFEALMADDAALHTNVFGVEFARAYASVAVGDATAPAK